MTSIHFWRIASQFSTTNPKFNHSTELKKTIKHKNKHFAAVKLFGTIFELFLLSLK